MRADRWRVLVAAIAAWSVAAASGAVLGGATSWGQTMLGSDIRSLANAASGWAVPTFVIVLVVTMWARARRWWIGAIMGGLLFSAMLQGYAAVSTWRGFPDSYGPGTFFFWAAVIGGPVLGVGATWQHSERQSLRAWGIAPLTAILIGEGAYGLLFLLGSTSAVYWAGVLALGCALTLYTALRRLAETAARWVAVALTSVGSIAFVALYRLARG